MISGKWRDSADILSVNTNNNDIEAQLRNINNYQKIAQEYW